MVVRSAVWKKKEKKNTHSRSCAFCQTKEKATINTLLQIQTYIQKYIQAYIHL